MALLVFVPIGIALVIAAFLAPLVFFRFPELPIGSPRKQNRNEDAAYGLLAGQESRGRSPRRQHVHRPIQGAQQQVFALRPRRLDSPRRHQEFHDHQNPE
jgi:hypothetical protein